MLWNGKQFSWARTLYNTLLKTVELQSKASYSWTYEEQIRIMHFVHFLLWQLPNHASRLNKFSWARTMYSTSLKTIELQSKSLYSWMYETKSESRASCNSCSGSFQTMLCGYETICYEIETTLMSTHAVQHITENLRFTLKSLIFLNVWKTIRIICFVQLMLWQLPNHALWLRNLMHTYISALFVYNIGKPGS